MISDLERKFEEILQKLQTDLATIRTGRASTALVEDLPITVYGSTMTLKELASITVPEPRQILISPWDKSILTDIEKGLRAKGFNPAAEETVLRVVLPSLTGEEREKLQREAGERAEEARVAIRMARREEVARIENAKKNKEISEDDEFNQKKQIDALLENYNRKIEEIYQDKLAQLAL